MSTNRSWPGARAWLDGPAHPEDLAGRETRRRPKRYWGRRLVVGTCALVILATLVAGGGYAYVAYRYSQIHKVALRGLGDAGPSKPMTVLVVGSDSRADLRPGQDAEFGSAAQVGGQRADVIMLVRLDPEHQQAAVLSVPRDLYVPIAGRPTPDRINTAFEHGPQQLVDTIGTDLGIAIDHYVQVNFDAFRSIVDGLGGLDVYFAAPARDAFSGLSIAGTGCVHLDGDAALAYVRSRHYQSYEGGTWRTDPTSDLGRIKRQQALIATVAARATARGLANPLVANTVIGAAVANLTIDAGLTQADLVGLARRFHSLDVAAIDALTLPTDAAVVGGADILKLSQPDAAQAVDRFLGRAQPPPPPGPPTSVAPASVRLRVLNGSGRRGQASALAAQLRQAGFVVVATADADPLVESTTVIRYSPAQQAKAEFVRALLVGGARLQPQATTGDADLVVVTGSDFAGLGPPAPLPPPTTTQAGPTSSVPPPRC